MKLTSNIQLPKKAMRMVKPDMALLGSRVVGIIEGGIAEQYRSEGGASGANWSPLKPSTLAKRRKGKGSRGSVQILRDTGTMVQSLTSGGGRAAYRKITRMDVTVGTQVPYAVFHQYGTRRMVKREHVVLTPNARRRISELARFTFIVGPLR